MCRLHRINGPILWLTALTHFLVLSQLSMAFHQSENAFNCWFTSATSTSSTIHNITYHTSRYHESPGFAAFAFHWAPCSLEAPSPSTADQEAEPGTEPRPDAASARSSRVARSRTSFFCTKSEISKGSNSALKLTESYLPGVRQYVPWNESDIARPSATEGNCTKKKLRRHALKITQGTFWDKNVCIAIAMGSWRRGMHIGIKLGSQLQVKGKAKCPKCIESKGPKRWIPGDRHVPFYGHPNWETVFLPWNFGVPAGKAQWIHFETLWQSDTDSGVAKATRAFGQERNKMTGIMQPLSPSECEPCNPAKNTIAPTLSNTEEESSVYFVNLFEKREVWTSKTNCHSWAIEKHGKIKVPKNAISDHQWSSVITSDH